MIVREIAAPDVEAVTAIYGRHVLSGLGSFEEAPPTPEELARRIAAVRALGLPYLVADDGDVVSFATSSFGRAFASWYTAEDSIYVADGAMGRGVGRALLTAVIDRCAALGLRQLMAIIGDGGNTALDQAHRALGFELLGVGRSVGFKRGR